MNRLIRYRVGIWVLLVGVWLPTYAQSPLFNLVPPQQTGVDFTNAIDENEKLNVLSYEYFYNGGGVAVGDFNNDGLLDIFFTANQKPNRLYLNLGGLRFRDITKEAGLGGRSDAWKTGVCVADVNADGWLDLYVCYSGKGDANKRRNQLFINQKNLKFKDQAPDLGLDDPGYGTQAAFFDYDRDGDLDMFLLNHNVKKFDNMELAKFHTEADPLAGNKLFENRNGHFSDVSQKAGIHQYPLTFGLGMVVADINLDGWPDVYVTNDYNEPDYLYVNQKNGTFRDETEQRFRHLAQFSMGIDIADFNNDGLPDVMSLDMLPEDNRRQKLLQLQENYESFELMEQQQLQKQYMRNMLQLNNGDGTFSEIAQLAGVAATDWSWSPLLADLDNDGYKDLYVTNGYLRDYTNKDFLKYWGDYKVQKAINRETVQLMDLVRAMPSTKLPNYGFRNNQNLTFTNSGQAWGLTEPSISNGAVCADLDNDGDLELIVNNINQPAFIYQNLSREQQQTHYLQVLVKGKDGNTQAIGSRVGVYVGGKLMYQEVQPIRGYLSSQPTTLHFGLGTASQADSVVVVWPDGSRQHLAQVASNQRLTITYAPTSKQTLAAPPAAAPVFSRVTSPVSFTHESSPENDFKRQLLMLWMYSHVGPVLAEGDVNKDGLADLFVGSGGSQKSNVWLQQPDGSFIPQLGFSLPLDSVSTVADAAFFDANGDGFDDLYVAKGGYSTYEPNTAALQDMLLLNDGKGNLYVSAALPHVSASSKACVRPYDYDGDGDMDVFVGGRVIPGRYPEPPVSYLLQNNGKGQFRQVPNPFASVGMVTDARWADIDADGRADLIVCGEFMPIRIYANTPTGFIDKTATYFQNPPKGFWSSLAVADLNGDGQLDIIAGNLGQNSQIRASATEPAELVYADFDQNGSIDPFFSFWVQGKSYPFVSRDEMNEQMYAMRRKYSFYKEYADATITDLFSADQLTNARKLSVTETQTMVFLQKNGRFETQTLPIQAQFAPVSRILTDDFDHDGQLDVLLLGNRTDNRLKIGSIDANYGCLLKGDGKGGFTYISQPQAGLSVKGDVKSAVKLTIGSQPFYLIGVFNQPLYVYKTP